MNKPSFILLDGTLCEESEALVSPINRGLMYGDSCFDTLRLYHGQFLQWERHFARLKEGLGYLRMGCPWSSSELKKDIMKLLRENGLTQGDAMVRLQVWREGGRGYRTEASGARWMIQASPYEADKDKALNLTIAETRCIPSKSLKRTVKLGSGLNYVQAAAEARDANCDNALMFTIDDYISETTTANVFWVKGHRLFTPSVSCDLLPGVMRSIIIDLCKQEGIPVIQGEYQRDELKEAEALFCCNSLIEIQPVHTVGDLTFDEDHQLIQKLKQLISGYKEIHLKE
ncbi:MAG: hypothetical protein FH748_08410 [Balneolaceae bacterium]|nr:hypothetical protein [Balneolaceae bacterium]